MRVDLSSEFDTYIQSLLEAGRFQNAAEAVEAALAFFRHHDESQDESDTELAARFGMSLDELKREVQIGIDDADRGAVREWNLQQFLVECRADRRM
ncbi:MAG: hypothetical protein ACKVS9_17655 [Phycisphaerae bacterium]